MCRSNIVLSVKTSGFTLIEVMVVLVIAGVLVALGAPRIDSSKTRADAATNGLRGALQLAQRSALVRQHDIIVSFDTARSRYRVAWDANNNAVVDSTERAQWQSLETGNRFTTPSQGLFGAVTGSVIGVGLRTLDGMPTLTFHRDGSVSTDAEIYLTTAAQRTGVTSRAIRLIQATGRADWYRRFANGPWTPGKL